MTNDFWAEGLPTFSFTSLNPSLDPDPGKAVIIVKSRKQQQTTDVLPFRAAPLLAPAGVRAAPTSSSAQSSEGSVSFATEVWSGRDVGAFKWFKCSKQDRSIRLELGKNREIGYILRLWPMRRNIWWRKKKSSGDQNKMEQDQALGGCWPEGVTQGGISAGLAFTVLLKRLNLRLKGKHLDLLLDWLNKNVKVGSLWDLEWK